MEKNAGNPLILGLASLVVPELFKVAGSVFSTWLGSDSSDLKSANSTVNTTGTTLNGLTFRYDDLNGFYAINYEPAGSNCKGLYLSNNPAVDNAANLSYYTSIPPYDDEGTVAYLDNLYPQFQNGAVTISNEPPVNSDDSSVNVGGVITPGVLYATIGAVTVVSTIAIGGGFKVYTNKTSSGAEMGISATNTLPQTASASVTVTTPSGTQVTFTGSYSNSNNSSTNTVGDSETELIVWQLPDDLVPTEDSLNIFTSINVDFEFDEATASQVRKASRSLLTKMKVR